jgi:hypothetical protein
MQSFNLSLDGRGLVFACDFGNLLDPEAVDGSPVEGLA